MSSLYFPLASLLICLFLFALFYNKKRQKNNDTKLYSKMLWINLAETLTTIYIVVVAKTMGTNPIVYLGDRIDFMLISLWCINLSIYVYNISVDSNNPIVRKIFWAIKGIIVISLSFVSFEVINYKDIINTSGLAPTLVGAYCAIAALIMLCCLTKKIISKTEKIVIKKYYPLFVFIVLILVALFARKYWPTMLLEPFMISFIDLIMFFTIENPDLKVINELTLAKENIEKHNNEKSAFIFNMSQNIREPLKSIERFTGEIIDSDDKEIIKDDALAIKNEVQNLQFILNEALNITSIDAQNIKLVNESYDLRKIIEPIKIKVESLIKDKPISFNMSVSETLPEKFYGDSIRMKQIISTLLLNAVKYTDDGYIELKVDSFIKHDVCRLIITVEDSGCGMKSKVIDELFETTESEESFSDDKKLDLKMIKKLVNYIGGTIIVQSEVKRGSKFIVTLDQKIDEKDNDFGINITKIMLISNRDYLTKQLGRVTESLNVDLSNYKNGAEALTELRSGKRYNLIILDSKIDKIDYNTLYDKIKDINNLSIPIVLVSSKEEDKEKYLDVLSEPIKSSDIESILKQLK